MTQRCTLTGVSWSIERDLIHGWHSIASSDTAPIFLKKKDSWAKFGRIGFFHDPDCRYIQSPEHAISPTRLLPSEILASLIMVAQNWKHACITEDDAVQSLEWQFYVHQIRDLQIFKVQTQNIRFPFSSIWFAFPGSWFLIIYNRFESICKDLTVDEEVLVQQKKVCSVRLML